MNINFFSTLIIVLISFSNIFSQTDLNIALDVIIYDNPINTEYNSKKMLTEYLEEADIFECTTINIIDSISEGTSPYILEYWESEEFLSNYVFKEKREKTETVNKKQVTKKYTASGVKVRTMIDFYGRLSEREGASVLDVFRINGNIDREILDSQVGAKYKPKWIDNQELNDAMLLKHEKKIITLREGVYNHYKNSLAKGLITSISTHLFPPIKLGEAVEIKKDKLTKINYLPYCSDKYFNADMKGLAYAVYEKNDIAGTNVYYQTSTVYGSFEKDDLELKVRKGKKELLLAYNEGKEFYLGNLEYLEAHDLSENKKDSRSIYFDINYVGLLKDYGEIEKTNIELEFQAKLLGHKNLKVLRMNPTLTDDYNLERDGVVSVVTVLISDLKKNSLTNKLSWFGKMEILANVGGESLQTNVDFEAVKHSNRTRLYLKDLTLGEIASKYINRNLEIIGVVEEKKDEIKSVMVKSLAPMNGGKYKLYDTDKITKKTKSIAELHIKNETGRYTAIAEVKKGKKDISAFVNGEKPYFLIAQKKQGLASLFGDIGYNFGGIRNIKLK